MVFVDRAFLIESGKIESRNIERIGIGVYQSRL